MTQLFAHVLIDDVAEHGTNAAIVLAQLRFKLYAADHEPGERPWYTPPPKSKDGTSELQRLTGLSSPQIRRAMAKLVENGAVEARQLAREDWDQRYSYRPATPIQDPTVSRGDEIVRSDDPEPETRGIPELTKSSNRVDESRGSSISKETTINYPPTPLGGGQQEAASLFDDDPVAAGSDSRAEVRRRSKRADVHPMTEAQYRTWVENEFPPNASGDRATGLRAWQACMKAGVTVAEISEQTANYVAALAIWAETFEETRKPMSPSVFLARRRDPEGGKRLQWSEPWDFDRCAGYWPAPKGRTWDRPRRRRRRSEILAEVEGAQSA